MKRLMLATQNRGKLAEVAALLPGVHVASLLEHPEVEMPEEVGERFEEIAARKAEHVARLLGVPALADDSGLEVDALGGAPGVRSARYAEGSDRDRWEKLLAALEDVPQERRQARFVCAMALAAPGRETVVVRGTCEGEILRAPSGEGGFGYDPVFLPRGQSRTMAELHRDEKGAISHRGRALRAIEAQLAALFA